MITKQLNTVRACDIGNQKFEIAGIHRVFFGMVTYKVAPYSLIDSDCGPNLVEEAKALRRKVREISGVGKDNARLQSIFKKLTVRINRRLGSKSE